MIDNIKSFALNSESYGQILVIVVFHRMECKICLQASGTSPEKAKKIGNMVVNGHHAFR